MSEQNITIIIIGWVITGIIAIIGWIVAAIRAKKNRDLRKTIEQKKMRHDAYRAFMVEMDSISKQMSMNPISSMGKIYMDFFTKIIKNSSDPNALDQCLIEFNTEIWKSIETASLPLLKISQAIATVRLDASEELMPMLLRLKALTEDFNNEWQKALSTFSKDQKGMQSLATLGQDARWKEFQTLSDEIIEQMRKECNIE